AGPDGVDRTLEYEFGRDFLSVWNDGASIKVKYRYAKIINIPNKNFFFISHSFS
ncbi:unnamed protein product, partial [marine sediment metagenome]